MSLAVFLGWVSLTSFSSFFFGRLFSVTAAFFSDYPVFFRLPRVFPNAAYCFRIVPSLSDCPVLSDCRVLFFFFRISRLFSDHRFSFAPRSLSSCRAAIYGLHVFFRISPSFCLFSCLAPIASCIFPIAVSFFLRWPRLFPFPSGPETGRRRRLSLRRRSSTRACAL